MLHVDVLSFLLLVGGIALLLGVCALWIRNRWYREQRSFWLLIFAVLSVALILSGVLVLIAHMSYLVPLLLIVLIAIGLQGTSQLFGRRTTAPERRTRTPQEDDVWIESISVLPDNNLTRAHDEEMEEQPDRSNREVVSAQTIPESSIEVPEEETTSCEPASNDLSIEGSISVLRGQHFFAASTEEAESPAEEQPYRETRNTAVAMYSVLREEEEENEAMTIYEGPSLEQLEDNADEEGDADVGYDYSDESEGESDEGDADE